MSSNPKKIELLAPAKDKQGALCAVDCGADAVYIGFSRFGARAMAGNSLKDIKEIVDYAHIYRVKVYVTLNTILTDTELAEVEKVIYDLYSIGVDGIIVQDMGILELASSPGFVPIPIIASTQCHNNTLEKIKFLENTGFKRVILPREFTLNDIKNISEHTNIELEAFVHGALCVSYSGQCYLSHFIGKRSANRGNCAQPCRKKYTLVDKSGKIISSQKYLLSLKDFNLSEHLSDLIKAGVTSFKIEGRLKDLAYIKNVVSFYNYALNKLGVERTSVGNSNPNFTPNLNKTFNRGYTTYNLCGKTGDIAAPNHTKSIGEFVGTVKTVNDNFFTLDTGAILNNADGICFFTPELAGTSINKVESGKIYPRNVEGIKKGMKIYRNLDHKFLKELESRVERKIPVSLLVEEIQGNLIFKITDPEEICAEITLKNTFEVAKNPDEAIKTIKQQLLKLGTTEFEGTGVEINIGTTPFIPASRLNDTRRELVQKLQEARHTNYKRDTRTTQIQTVPYPKKTLTYAQNVYNERARKFYEERGVEHIEQAFEALSFTDMKNKTLMSTKHCLRREFKICTKTIKGAGQKAESLTLIDEHGAKYTLDFDCKNCTMLISHCGIIKKC